MPSLTVISSVFEDLVPELRRSACTQERKTVHGDRLVASYAGTAAPVLWQNAVVLKRLTERKEWKFFAVLPKADGRLAAAWWASLLLRGILPAGFAIAMG